MVVGLIEPKVSGHTCQSITESRNDALAKIPMEIKGVVHIDNLITDSPCFTKLAVKGRLEIIGVGRPGVCVCVPHVCRPR